LNIFPGVSDDLFAPRHRKKALASAGRLLESIGSDLVRAPWYNEQWCGDVLERKAAA
jgi:hypothetical protein